MSPFKMPPDAEVLHPTALAAKAGKVVGDSVVGRHITSHRQAQAALRLSEGRLRVALKHAPVVVFTQDLQLRYTWITPPVLAWDYRNLLGSTDAKSFGAWDHRSFVGCTDAEIFGEEQGARLTAIKQEVLRTGVGSRTEGSLTFDGVTRHSWQNLSVMLGEPSSA